MPLVMEDQHLIQTAHYGTNALSKLILLIAGLHFARQCNKVFNKIIVCFSSHTPSSGPASPTLPEAQEVTVNTSLHSRWPQLSRSHTMEEVA